MKGVILAGGRGTRLRPLTHTGPKQLVPVANKPVLQYAIEDLRAAGITDIGVILGNIGREEIQEFLGDGSRFGVDITYIIQGNPLGLAHAVGCAEAFVDGDDLGDNIFSEGVTPFVEAFATGEYDAGIALQRVETPEQFGVAEVDDTGTVHELTEKPDNPPSNLALVGIYAFSPVIFEAIRQIEPSWRGELEITDAIQVLLDEDRRVESHIVDGWWKDTGKPTDILEANRLILDDLEHTIEGTLNGEADVAAPVKLASSATIESGAVVRGPAVIGPGTTIDADTYVGPYTAIGEHCTLAGVRIENSVVVGDSTITAAERIVDSLIGRGAHVETADGLLPEGRRLVLGENSSVKL